MKMLAKTGLILVCGATTALLVAGAISVTTSRPANAKPEFAAQTGLPCGRCHVNPAGGGKNTSFGEKFKANGNKLPK